MWDIARQSESEAPSPDAEYSYIEYYGTLAQNALHEITQHIATQNSVVLHTQFARAKECTVKPNMGLI